LRKSVATKDVDKECQQTVATDSLILVKRARNWANGGENVILTLIPTANRRQA
jgi:hypothetical protein